MKRLFLLVVFVVPLIMATTIQGATWYVDGWNGLDTNDGTGPDQNAFLTIRRALNECSNGDSIHIVGPFVEAPWDTSYGGGDTWDTNNGDDWRHQISIYKSNITLYGVAVEGNLPVIYGYSPNDSTSYVLRIDNTSNKVDNIKFDGYYDVAEESVYTHDVIYMTPDADYAQIVNCEFTNFGAEWHPNFPDDYYFYGIITGGKQGQSNELTNFTINDNEFNNNQFASKGAHELYLNRASNGTQQHF
jgi:hypothetical protein